MKFTSLAAKALLATAIAIPALPAAAKTNSSTSADVEAPATAGKADEAKVCKRIEMTGSRTRTKRLCLTSKEWKKIDDEPI